MEESTSSVPTLLMTSRQSMLSIPHCAQMRIHETMYVLIEDKKVKAGNTDNRLGDMIYKAREARGIATSRLAADLGLHHSVVARIQLGQIKRPNPALLARIAEALELNVGELHALAGYTTTDQLPDLQGWLNTKHRGLPEAATRDLQGHLDYLIDKHGLNEEETRKEGT